MTGRLLLCFSLMLVVISCRHSQPINNSSTSRARERIELMRTFPQISPEQALRAYPDLNPKRELAVISSSLERRITVEEARDIAGNQLTPSMQQVHSLAASDENARFEWEFLNSRRQRTSSRFDAFLSRAYHNDELWTYSTITLSCRESGLALVRQGKVVDHLPLIIAYVGWKQ